MVDDTLNPSTITTLAELGVAWNRLIEQAGLSGRRLAERAATTAGGVPLSRPTISDIVNGRRLPSREQQIRFLALVGVTDEDELEVWDEAWSRLSEQQSRFGSQDPTSALPIGAFLESGPEEAALRQLRRWIPEAGAELEKLGPGSAAMILSKWPDEIVAEILAAMDVRSATAVLLARPAGWRIAPVLRKMPAELAAECLKGMGAAGTASARVGWTGPWFLPRALRRNEDPLFADIHEWRRAGALAVGVFAGGSAVVMTAVFAAIWGIDRWLGRHNKVG